MTECKNLDAFMQLECIKSHELILDIVELLQQHVHKPLVLSSFNYYHDKNEYQEGRNDSASMCYIENMAQYCRYNCTDIVLSEAIILQKGSQNVLMLMKTLLEGKTDNIIEISKSLGIDVLRNVSYTYSQTTHQLNNLNFNLEAGGGAGIGFQLYCDDEFSLTLGFGGGGGLEYNANSFSYGGGFGGGLQYVEHNSSKLFSVGGGGGCGTKENSGQLECGGTVDSNMYENVTYVIAKLKNRYDTCNKIFVSGGGGGGGGTSECCAPFMTGYGYSFTITSDNMTAAVTEYSDLDNNASNSNNSNNNQDFRYSHDTIKSLLLNCSTSCRGYGNWSCIQIAAQENVAFCKHVDSPYCSDLLHDYYTGSIDWLLSRSNKTNAQNKAEFNYYTNITGDYIIDTGQLQCDSAPLYKSSLLYSENLQNIFLLTIFVVFVTQCFIVVSRHVYEQQRRDRNTNQKLYQYGGINT